MTKVENKRSIGNKTMIIKKTYKSNMNKFRPGEVTRWIQNCAFALSFLGCLRPFLLSQSNLHHVASIVSEASTFQVRPKK